MALGKLARKRGISLAEMMAQLEITLPDYVWGSASAAATVNYQPGTVNFFHSNNSSQF
jgi:hypothetical protein